METRDTLSDGIGCTHWFESTIEHVPSIWKKVVWIPCRLAGHSDSAGFVLRCAPLQWYRAPLCTIDLHCAPPTCIVHHGAEGGLLFLEVGVIRPVLVPSTGLLALLDFVSFFLCFFLCFLVSFSGSSSQFMALANICLQMSTVYGIFLNIFHFLLVHMNILKTHTFCQWTGNYSELLQFPRWVHSEHALVVHKGTDTEYSHLVVHNVHTNQGSQCM